MCFGFLFCIVSKRFILKCKISPVNEQFGFVVQGKLRTDCQKERREALRSPWDKGTKDVRSGCLTWVDQ